MTCEGAKALGLSSITGSLEIGKEADLIVIDTNKAHALPLHNPYAHMVYAACGQDVRHTVVAGKVLMRDYSVLSLDEEAILENAVRWGNKISTEHASQKIAASQKESKTAQLGKG